MKECIYAGRTPLSNSICLACSLFLCCCEPILDPQGFAAAAECDQYLCPGCPEKNCPNY